MSDDLLLSMRMSAMGMRAQGARIRVLTENVANADTTGQTPGSDPYRRQTISFKNELNRDLGVREVKVSKIGKDMGAFELKYIPGHPAADEKGYVKMPNVKSLIEVMDVREAQRSYEANLGMIDQARSMIMRTIDLLRA
jgi:flagellar basal-body rod protein FlgC